MVLVCGFVIQIDPSAPVVIPPGRAPTASVGWAVGIPPAIEICWTAKLPLHEAQIDPSRPLDRAQGRNFGVAELVLPLIVAACADHVSLTCLICWTELLLKFATQIDPSEPVVRPVGNCPTVIAG